ncbi:sugar ABC transporter permease [Catenulispora subtropica]|uniref:Sugar ABC transporter permease n=1 Tax=Catenulispora subtropica TaxID=450798 RepID=A0ABP5CF68_9ACTN
MSSATIQDPPRTRRVRGGSAARGPRGSHTPVGAAPLERSRRRMFWAFTAPAVIVYGVLFLLPVGYAAWTSFYKWDGISDKKWKGLGNYQTLWQDPIFRQSLGNTLKTLVIGGLITFVISFGLMLILREMNRRLFARAVLFFPCLVNAMVFGIAAGVLFSPDGPVNQALKWLGWSRPPQWLATEHLPTMILGTLVWTATGYYTAILMAAVDQIPEYLYEAAELDGANAFQRFRHVTLPMCWDVISVCAVLWTVSSVKIFELILMYGGSSGSQPPTDSWNTAMYVYEEAFPQASTPQLGLATAAALVSLFLVVVFTVVLRRILRRDPIEY